MAEATEQRERPARFERRMSDAEALMWNLEKDPSLRSSFLNITIVDRVPDFASFRERIAGAVVEIPRLRQRVVPSPARLAPPEWVDDPSFDLDFHVRRLALPPPGTDRQLLDLASVHYQDAFDRARPLWQFTIVEGLSGGRAALLAKMHHTITDGVGGVRLSARFLDIERAPAAPPTVPPPVADAAAGTPSGFAEVAADALGHVLRRQLGIGRRAAAGVIQAIAHPDRLPRQAVDTVAIVRSLARQLVVTDAARSPLWTGRRSLGRHFEILTVDLDRLKRTANSLGGTVNDAFVTGVAGGAGAYHREKGAEVAELRMTMPISTRGDGSMGGNAFSPARVLVPAGTKDPFERFSLVRERLATTKGERSLRFTDAFAAILNAIPTSLIVDFVRAQVQTIDFATSNVRGAPFDLFVGGAEILANHPMGPTGGTAFNATVMSYRSSFDIGLAIDAAAVDDPALLRACIVESFEELVAGGT